MDAIRTEQKDHNKQFISFHDFMCLLNIIVILINHLYNYSTENMGTFQPHLFKYFSRGKILGGANLEL